MSVFGDSACVGAGAGGSESGNQKLSDRIFRKEIVRDALSSLPPPPGSPKEPGFFVGGELAHLGHLSPGPRGLLSGSALILVTLAHTFDFLSPPRTSNLLPNTGSLPEPSAGPWKVPRLCAPYSGLILTRAILGLWVLAARAPSPWEARPKFGHIRGAGRGGPGEALGSWVARQTSKPQRILSPQEEVRPQLVPWERVSAAAWRASDLLGLGHRRGRSGTQPLASGV